MAITRLNYGSSFKNLVKSDSFLDGNPPFFPSSFESIATVTVSSPTSSISFTSIPQTYKHLQIRGIAKTDMAGYQQAVWCTLNGDTGANYGSHFLYGDYDGSTSTVSAGGPQGTSFIQVCYAGAMGSNPASQFGASIIDIHDYTSTTKNKVTRSISGANANLGGGRIALGSGLWKSTSAITSISLILDSASFVAGSTFALYGIL